MSYIFDFTVSEKVSVRALMRALDQTGLRIILVVDSNKILRGVVTDGDLRRALLAGASLDDPASKIMNHTFVSLPVSTPRSEAKTYLSNRISLVPLVDEHGVPVDAVVHDRRHHIPAAEPVLEGNELNYVIDCMESGWISSQGAYIRRFEEMFADYCGVKEAIAVSNGTVALHLALRALNIRVGDEVLVPDLTFAASINAILHAGATPVIVDILPETLTIDPAAVEAAMGPRTKAVMPVHLYGQMCHMDTISDIAKRNGLFVVEDAAEALGSCEGNSKAGSIGDAGTFSFFGNKLITTGEGGMLLFRDPSVAAYARMLRDHGMDPQRRYWHLEIGYNYRMTNLQAAVGVAQLERVDSLLAAKIRLAERYREGLSGLQSFIELPATRVGTQHSYWNFPILLRGGTFANARDGLLERLRDSGFDARPLFYPLHAMPPYKDLRRYGDCPVSSSVSRCGFTLPSSPKVTNEEADYISSIVRRELDHHDWSGLIGGGASGCAV